MQAIPSFLFTPYDLKTFLGLYVGVNPFRAPPGAMDIAENVILRSQGVLEARPGFTTSATAPLPIDGISYKPDQKQLFAISYPSSLQTQHPSLGHRSPFAAYDWQKDSWTPVPRLPGAVTFDQPEVGVRTRFATANNALFFQSKSGLLKVEDAISAISSSNLIQESERLATSPWTVGGAVVTNFALTGPDGNVAAAKLQTTATTATHFVQHPYGAMSGSNYCLSIFAKAGTVSWLRLIEGPNNSADFDLTHGVTGTIGSGATAAIYPIPGTTGWYRCVMNCTNSTGTAVALHLADTQAHLGTSWTAAGTENVFLYGAQLEPLSPYSPVPIIHTQGGTASRATGAARPAMLVKPWTQPVGSTWAGTTPALTAAGTWLQPGNQVAYRYTIARKGANQELIESEPSERVIVVNTSAQAQGVSFTFDAHPMYPRDAFLRLYRSAQVGSTSDPSDECFLIAEAQMPALAPLGADGYIYTASRTTASLTDLTPDTALFVPLYTNPSTGEGRGLLDSNNTAPAARDLCSFRNRVYFCGVRDIHRLIIKLIGTGASGVNTNSSVTIDGVTFSFAADDTAALAPQVFTSGTVAQNLENTARALVAHINYYFSGRTGAFHDGITSAVYASYLSVSSGGAGQILLQRLVPGASPIRFSTSSRNGWDKDYTTGTTSTDSVQAAGVAWSKVGQPESVPIANYAVVGDASMEASRLLALRQSLFLFKRDGLYNITDDGTGPSISVLDPTIKLIAPQTAVTVDNTIIGLTESGVVLVSEGSGAVNISDDQIGRQLRKLILYVGYSKLADLAYGVSYQGQRQYVLALPESPTATACTLYYIYNLQTQAWTTQTLPYPTTSGLAQFDQNVLYYAGPLALGDSFRGFMVQRSSGGSSDYQDLTYKLPSYASTATSTLIFGGDLTKPVFATPNFITDSQDRFSQANWTRVNVTATDLVTSRGTGADGNVDVSVLADNITNAAHSVTQSQTLEVGQTYTFSASLKKGTLNFASLSTSTTSYAVFNLNTGTVTSQTGVNPAWMVSQGNGWYRCGITFVYSGAIVGGLLGPFGSQTLTIQLGTTAVQATPGNTYAGSGSDLLLNNVQLERAPAMSTYVATPVRCTLAVGDVIQQFQSSKCITQTITSVAYSSATGQTTVTLDATPGTAWTLADSLTVRKAIQSRWRMLPQMVDHPLTQKIWREAFLSFRYLDLDFMSIEWTSESFQYSTNNPANEVVASPTVDAAPILALPFANKTGPFAQYVFGRQTRDVVLKATMHPEVISSGQLILGATMGQAGRRFEINGFDVVMSGKTERTVR